MTGPMRVEPSELRAKGTQITEPWPLNPAYPSPPCALELAHVAVQQIYASTKIIEQYVASGEAEAVRLSESLYAAATAYELVDERTRQALEQGLPAPSDPVVPTPNLSPPVPLPPGLPIGACPAPDFKDVLTAATEISAPDQAATLDSFASAWSSYAGALDRRADSFQLDDVNWEGGAAESAETALRNHQQWLQQMADTCQELAQQAQDLAAAHRNGVADHPTVPDVEDVVTRIQTTQDPIQRAELMGLYMALQAQSEQALAKYAGDAIMNGVSPPAPPSGAPTPVPVTGNGAPRRARKPTIDTSNKSTQNGAGGGPPSAPPGPATGEGAAMPQGVTPPEPAAQGAAAPSGGSPAGGARQGGGSPGGGASGGMPGGLPGGAPPGQPSVPKLPTDPRLTPAGSGGGAGGGAGGGGGGGGVPDLPLSSAVTGEAVAPSPVQGASPGAGRAATAGAAPMGMGGGMGPMMGHRGGGESNEKHRSPDLAPDERLYAEDRPWTEAVIGNRRRKETQDAKESK